MRLYHLNVKKICAYFVLLIQVGCAAPQVTQGLINVSISVDNQTANLSIPAGSTVQDLIQIAGVSTNPLDRSEPPLYTVLKENSLVKVVRVTEEYSVDQKIVPFDKQIVRNESLAEGESRLIQPGVNGIEEITIRKVIEDGVEVSSNSVKTVLVQEPVAEVVMVGSQNPFTPLTFPGKIVYLAAGNAWMMEDTTSNRVPVVTSGDLDGRIFRLSPDGEWLLFTRRGAEEENKINSLWAAKITESEELLIDLQADNVIHFADWVPQSQNRVVYSTVEPREAPPGWQANNDLNLINFSVNGWVSRKNVLLEANSGGIYGWWGMSFVWADDGFRLVYARPDGIGLIDLNEGEELVKPILELLPMQTQGDWAWVPGVSLSPSQDILYSVAHIPSTEDISPESSPLFDLAAIPLDGGRAIHIVPQVGMFAYPVASPFQPILGDEKSSQVAYLQAIFPIQSDTSRYHLIIMDRDGSNRKVIFPQDGNPGLDPQIVNWSPESFGGNQAYWIALTYQGNLWVIDTISGETRQITGDGLIDRLDWR